MKKIVKLLLALTLSLGFFVKTASAQAETVDEIKEKGVIVLGTSADYPPYEFIATVDGKEKVVGMDVLIAEQYAKELGVKLEVKNMDFDSLLVGLETGKIDFAISGLNPTNERKKSADFSDVYYNSGQGFLVNKNDKKLYSSYKSFKDKKVGVQTGSLQQELAKTQMKSTSLSEMTKITDLLLALKSNKVQGVLVESAVGEAYSAHDKEIAYVPGKLKTGKDELGSAIAFPKNSPELVAAANTMITKIKKEDKIKQYLDEAGKYIKPTKAKESSLMIVLKYWNYFAKGLGYTIFISIVSITIGIILGIIFALMRLGKNKIIKQISKAFVEFIRGTPLMIQLMFVYFGLSKLLNLDISPLVAGIISVSINSGAYVSEIIRGGINSVSQGQMEAARSLGMTYKDAMQSVIMPQAIKNIWPALGNEFISLIKETSIVSIIGVSDLIFELRAVQAATYQGIIPIVIAMLIYFVITWSLSKLLNYFEGRMNHGTN